MKLRNCSLDAFIKQIENRALYCFGASLMPQEIIEEYKELYIEKKIVAFIDNSQEKVGTLYKLGDCNIPIISVEEMLHKISHNDILLITSKYYVQIVDQLNELDALIDLECYIWPAVAPQYKSDKELLQKIKRNEGDGEIPKKIHYFWFGKGEIPELHQKCIDSWHRMCQDYEIVRWDESNYDVTKNRYMLEAYKAKKWGFVSDYARLDIIYHQGGIYLDTDVEVIRPFDDLLGLEGFIGFESKNLVATGLGFGAKPGNQCIKKFMDDYENRKFIKNDGSYDLTTCPVLQTNVLKELGLKLNNKFQVVDDLVILPTECLAPDNNMIPHITENTFSIHHFAGSWTSDSQQKLLDKIRAFSKSIQEM